MSSHVVHPDDDSMPQIHAFGYIVPLGLVLSIALQVLIREESERATDEDDGVDADAEAGCVGRCLWCAGGGGLVGAGGFVAGLF